MLRQQPRHAMTASSRSKYTSRKSSSILDSFIHNKNNNLVDIAKSIKFIYVFVSKECFWHPAAHMLFEKGQL